MASDAGQTSDSDGDTAPEPYEAKWRTERRELAWSFCNQLERSCRIPGTIEPATIWILDTVLELTVDSEYWEVFCSRIAESISETHMIYGLWKRDGDDSIYLLMASDAWNKRRRDPFSNSPVWAVEYNDPIDSLRGIQTVKVVNRDSMAPIRYQYCFSKEHQTMAHFLRTSLRLRHFDITIVMRLLDGLDAEWEDFNRDRFMAKLSTATAKYSGATALMLRHAIEALKHAVVQGYFVHLPAAFAWPERLARLGEKRRISAADRSFKGNWTVLAHFRDKEAAATLRLLHPSFFVAWPPRIKCDPQVHLIEGPLQGFENCFLLSFPGDEPSDASVATVIEELRLHLKIDALSKTIRTLPFEKESRHQWFRCDGLADACFRWQILAIKLAEAMNEAKESGDIEKIPPLPKLMVPDREPLNLVPWTRQSSEEHKKMGSQDRQATTLLHNLPGMIRPGDTLEFIGEICSTHKHPIRDRYAWTELRWNRRNVICSGNPDRVTRREDEVDLIISKLKESGGFWFVKGDSLGEAFNAGTWYEMEGPIVEVVKTRLRLGRFRARQATFHGLQHKAVVRFLDYVDRTPARELNRQIDYFADILNLAVEYHGYEEILCLSHVSPSGGEAEKNSTKNSITRQGKLAEVLTGQADVLRLELKSQEMSASHPSFIKDLISKVKRRRKRVLILTLSVDRVCTTMDNYKTLRKAAEEGGHGVLSLTWDHETSVDVLTALRLSPGHGDRDTVKNWQKSLDASFRAPKLSSSLPVIQPILWMCGGSKDQNHPTEIAAERHVQNAKNFADSAKVTKYQGDPELDKEFTRKNGLFTTEEDAEKWKNRIKEITGLPETSIRVNYNNGRDAYYCTCSDKKRDDPKHEHDAACECRCGFCNKERSCPCAAKEKEHEPCECPPMCNCNCDCCHKIGVDHKRKRDDEDRTEDEKERKCQTAICTQKAPVNGPYGQYCYSCYTTRRLHKPCKNPTCHLEAEFPQNVCGACGEVDNRAGMRRTCGIPGCRSLARVGNIEYGRWCSWEHREQGLGRR